MSSPKAPQPPARGGWGVYSSVTRRGASVLSKINRKRARAAGNGALKQLKIKKSGGAPRRQKHTKQELPRRSAPRRPRKAPTGSRPAGPPYGPRAAAFFADLGPFPGGFLGIFARRAKRAGLCAGGEKPAAGGGLKSRCFGFFGAPKSDLGDPARNLLETFENPFLLLYFLLDILVVLSDFPVKNHRESGKSRKSQMYTYII